jgi:hypothetical protein
MLRRGLAAVALAGLGLAARQALTASFAFEATDPVPPRRASLPTSPLRDDPAGGCPLCREDLDVPVVPLSAADADSFGRVYAAFNAAWLGRADSLLAAGAFGSPASREARDKAHLMARLLVVNSLHYMVGFATDPERVYEASEATLRRAFQRYSDPGVYPIARMRRGRMGMGRICVRYDLAAPLDSTTDVGGQKLRIRVEDTQVDGTQQRMLVLEVPTILWNTVDVLLGEHFTCKAEFSRSDGPPAPYDLYLFYDVQGMYFRKWGTHQPMAVGFWSTPRDVTRQALPRSPLVGSAVYVPHVRFELPSFLPDLGFEDLRLVDVPQPILSLEYIEAKRYPSWMRRARPRGFKDWQSYGPIPPDLRLRFPDF